MSHNWISDDRFSKSFCPFFRLRQKVFYFMGPVPAMLAICPLSVENENQVGRSKPISSSDEVIHTFLSFFSEKNIPHVQFGFDSLEGFPYPASAWCYCGAPGRGLSQSEG